jgi:hypothetical protein
MISKRLAIGIVAFLTLVVVAALAIPTSAPARSSSQLGYRQMAGIRGAATCEGCELFAGEDCMKPNEPCSKCTDSMAEETVDSSKCPPSPFKKYTGAKPEDTQVGQTTKPSNGFYIINGTITCYNLHPCVDSGKLTNWKCSSGGAPPCTQSGGAGWFCRWCWEEAATGKHDTESDKCSTTKCPGYH